MKALVRLPPDAPIGTRVIVVRDGVSCDDHVLCETKTRTEPWRLANGEWVVKLEGLHSAWALGRCFLYPAAGPDVGLPPGQRVELSEVLS